MGYFIRRAIIFRMTVRIRLRMSEVTSGKKKWEFPQLKEKSPGSLPRKGILGQKTISSPVIKRNPPAIISDLPMSLNINNSITHPYLLWFFGYNWYNY